jgi:hypothetical protein
VGELDDAGDVGGVPGRHAGLGAVHVELQEVGTVVQLTSRVRHERIGVVGFDGVECRRERARPVEPRPADPQTGSIGPVPPALANPEAEGSCPAVGWVLQPRGPDVAGPAHPGLRQQIAVVLGNRQQACRRVIDALDPVRPARQRHMAVAVDEPRDDCRPSGDDDLERSVIGTTVLLAVAGPDPRDPVAFDEDADAELEPVAPAIRQRGVAVQDAPRRRDGTFGHGRASLASSAMRIEADRGAATIRPWTSRPRSPPSRASR